MRRVRGRDGAASNRCEDEPRLRRQLFARVIFSRPIGEFVHVHDLVARKRFADVPLAHDCFREGGLVKAQFRLVRELARLDSIIIVI